MATKLALGLVIGGMVSPTVGVAFKDVERRMQQMASKGAKARVLQTTIGDTMRLREEWKRAHESGEASAGTLLRQLDRNLDSLRRQGVEVANLSQSYQTLGQTARSAELNAAGSAQISAGREGLRTSLGVAAAGTAALAIPTKISGDYQALIRQMALWAHTAGESAEQEMADRISRVAQAKGMGQQALARAVGALIEKGIEWQESVDYAPLIADLVDGQVVRKVASQQYTAGHTGHRRTHVHLCTGDAHHHPWRRQRSPASGPGNGTRAAPPLD
ncbi:hypothetical protein [Pseudomonas sp. dw_358]|uniref:hypothetical protein n=1 Tax=Pseudomonas sp. dw_358 TaxID=2720083 RepID=UPI001BD3F905|nr:hypothetical protein [Pseudomonas sp. dw_358]